MLPFDPGSTSELLRASHIVLVAIESVSFGEWGPGGEMLVCQTVSARLRIERVLKGELDIPSYDPVAVAFEVYENRGPRFVALPGIWSQNEIAPGARFVVFSAAGSKEPAAVLHEPPAFHVEPAATALAEVESILQLATPETRLPALVAALGGRRETFTALTARYVAARLRELLFSDASGFHAVLAEAENPSAPTVFRRIVISEAYDDLMMLDPAPSVFIARLIWGSLRMFASGTAPEFAGRVLETYVPNLLGFVGGLSRKSAANIFRDAPKPRQEMETILRSHSELPGRERILAWLES